METMARRLHTTLIGAEAGGAGAVGIGQAEVALQVLLKLHVCVLEEGALRCASHNKRV